MPGFTLTVALVAAAAITIRKYFSGDKDDGHSPPRDSYHSSSSYNSGTRSQTQQSYRPPPQPYRPPPPRYSYYTPETNAQSKTTTRSPAPPDYSRDVYRESVASTRTLRQTQSSTRTQASRPYSSFFDHVPESPEYGYPHSSSHHCHICAGSESRLPTAPTVVSTDLYSDEPAIVEDLDYAKKLREKARRKGLEMSEARSRAKSAQKKGSRGAAHIHKQEAMVRESEMKDLDNRAAKIIFRENNKNRKEGGKIDLHGLYVAEAIQFAKDQVQTAQSRGDEVVRFITGKGLHAEGGVARIRPALENHFTKRGLDHSLEPNNTGVLIVRLD